MHKASLVDSSLHSPAMLELLELSVDRTLIEHVVRSTVDVVSFAMGDASTSVSSRGRKSTTSDKHESFSIFVSNVIRRAQVTAPMLLATLVYINRARPHLTIQSQKWACERVFLGALVLAAKYLNDVSLKNVHWAASTGVFGKRDVGRIEREFLDVLDWGLAISEADILDHHDTIMSLYDRRRRHHHHRPSDYHSRPTSIRTRTFHRDETEDYESAESSSSSSSASPRTPPNNNIESRPHQSFIKTSSTFDYLVEFPRSGPHASPRSMPSVMGHLPSHWSGNEAVHSAHAVPAVSWL